MASYLKNIDFISCNYDLHMKKLSGTLMGNDNKVDFAHQIWTQVYYNTF